MIALKGHCDVSSAFQKQCIIFNLGHFTIFLNTNLPGFLPYYDSYTGNIFFSHYLKSRSFQSYINNSWESMPAMCGNKLYARGRVQEVQNLEQTSAEDAKTRLEWWLISTRPIKCNGEKNQRKWVWRDDLTWKQFGARTACYMCVQHLSTRSV